MGTGKICIYIYIYIYTGFLGPRIRAALIHDVSEAWGVECWWVLSGAGWDKTQDQCSEILDALGYACVVKSPRLEI